MKEAKRKEEEDAKRKEDEKRKAEESKRKEAEEAESKEEEKRKAEDRRDLMDFEFFFVSFRCPRACPMKPNRCSHVSATLVRESRRRQMP